MNFRERNRTQNSQGINVNSCVPSLASLSHVPAVIEENREKYQENGFPGKEFNPELPGHQRQLMCSISRQSVTQTVR
jgi:hypothetical protein